MAAAGGDPDEVVDLNRTLRAGVGDREDLVLAGLEAAEIVG